MKQPKGAPRVYGEKWYLSEQTGHKTYYRKGETYTVWQPSIMDLGTDEVHQISVT